MRRRQKKEARPAPILRLAARFGYHPGRAMKVVLEWTEVIVVAVGLAVLIMSFVTVRMHVPTDSMSPAINGDPNPWKADSFFVDRITYYFRDPKPGDIVVFRHTEEVYVGSIIAGSPAAAGGIQPGERVLFLNTEPVYTTEFIESCLADWPTGTALRLTTLESGTHGLGAKGEGVATLRDLGIVVREKRMRYVKRLIATEGQTVQIRGGDVYVDGEKLTGERFDRTYVSDDPRFRFGVEPTVVPEGHYFVLGDNSADSFDSRFWGFVDDRDMIGVPYLRVWPLTRFGPM
jgi:signal peptidase I